MKIVKFLRVLAAAALLGSCATPKVAYFQDVQPEKAEQVLNRLDIRVRPEDKISILVSSKDPLLVSLFNLSSVSSSGSAGGSQGNAPGYTVDKNGDIDFPVLGSVHVAGMTREEIASYIKKELMDKNLVKDPIVTVEFQNLTVSVLGEVSKPGRYNIDKDRLSLIKNKRGTKDYGK